jgi:hypothetical protein
MSNINMQVCTPRGGSRLASPVWMLALLLVLHGAAQIGHHLPGNTLRPLLGALVPDTGPTFRPFGLSGHFPSVRSETRPLAGPPDRASEQDPPAAILPIAIALTGRAVEAPRLVAGEQPRSKVWRPFEARAPPTTA